MIRGNLATLAFLLTLAPAYGQERTPGSVPKPLSPRNASYSIDATLDPQRRALTGRETITWTNVSTSSVADLQFHLYFNAWRNADSTWMREAKLSDWWLGTSGRRTADSGSIDISSLKVSGASFASVDLTSAVRFIAPDDENTSDRTVISVALPLPVGPGQTIAIDISWTSKIPRPFARTGAIGNYFFLGQWFPKIGVVDRGGNWNCHQFHVLTEFFSDYGVYDVRMTIPSGWPVAATGQQRERRDNPDGTTMHRYYQEDVHDFAWTTSPDFIERRERFEQPGLPPVDMRLMLLPENAAKAERHFAAARTALRYYGEWFGAYPYGHITIIDPAWQSESDGMEYPTLFTVGFPWWSPREDLYLEDTVVHEAGHQWWYGIVGTNEVEDAWMDEGINQYANARVDAEAWSHGREVRRFFGGFVPWVMNDVPWDRVVDGESLLSYRAELTTDVQATPSYQWWPRTSTPLAYAKPALWLHTLERALGWTTMQRILAAFFEKWRFKHPRPGDFFQVANEVSGKDLGPFFDQVYRASVVFDYGVESVSSDEKADDMFLSDIVVRRYGDGIFPVTVLITFADGSTRREAWDGGGRWTRITVENHSRAVSAQVDPDRVLLLDTNFTNNSFTTEPHATRAAVKLASKWMVWLQDQLVTWAFFV
ncbi:MAG: M1 family metallopeptidase [Vicinamibacterales bacterium]|nr:M1 family metallopeptidase [Vicinamibacterales bacterium]